MEEKKYVTAEELEAARQDVLKFGGKHRTLALVFGNLTLVCALGLVPAIAFLQSGASGSDSSVPGFIFLGFCLAGVVVFAVIASRHQAEYMKYLNPYNAMYKTQFLPSILQSRLDKVFAFEPQNGLALEIVVNSGIFPGFDFIATNDYLRASYKDVNFEYCDMQLQQERTSTDSDGDTHTTIVTVFTGVFIVAEFDHFVNTPLFVRAGGGSGNVATESEVFNRNFSVSCDEAVDALRILTPQMMDDLLKLREYCRKPISLAFFDDKIFFQTEPGRDLLEIAVDIKKPIEESRKQIDKDIDFIIGILDRLNLRNLKSRASRKKSTDEDFAGNAVYQNEQY
jgi:hypothetical protein